MTYILPEANILKAQKILQNAINDYNVWASQKAKGYDPVKSYTDLRGIFFNKLRQSINNSGYKDMMNTASRHYSRTLYPEDINCQFNEVGYLAGLSFLSPAKHSNQDRIIALSLLTDSLGYIIFETHSEDVCYQLKQITESISQFSIK
jgi:hypothetical protein